MLEVIARFGSEDSRKQTLESHLLETAELARIFGKEFDFDALAGMAGLLHDAGKATSSWQKYLLDSISGKAKRKEDHATAGAVYLEEICEKKISLAKIAIQAAVMYHHGSGLPDMIGLDGKSEFLERLDKKEIKKDMEEIKVNLSSSIKQKIDECLQSEIMKNDARDVLFNNCKKGCSSEKQVRFNMGLHLRNLSSCLIDADRSDSAAFETNDNPFPSSGMPDWNNLLVRLENHLAKVKSKDALGKIRSYVSDRCASFGRSEKGIYTCSAFTGAGKTLASLRFALEQAKKHGMKRVFIIAPYTSIIDQNADVIRGILEDENTKGQIVLECHSNLSAEKKENLKESEENYSRFEETWNSPVIITTMVQFLETMFGSGTKKIRRMHQLANSVLVFDEVQTLLVKTTYLFNWGLEYLVNVCGCSALLCTATQPCLDKIGKEQFHIHFDGEIIEDVANHFSSLQRVYFIDKTDGGRTKSSVQKVCVYIQEELRNYGSFLAVVNTKPQAKELFKLVEESGCADFVYHLSTNMCPEHRRTKIEEIRKKLKNGEKVACISTRLIEAGVDVSFGGALRYLAGLDSIIQTAGRCNRNNELVDKDGNTIYGRVAIFDVENEKLGSLEELKIGKKCMERVLRDFYDDTDTENLNLIHPDIIERFFTYYYGEFSSAVLEYSIKNKDSTVLDLLSDNLESKREYERINKNQNWKQLLYTQAFRTAWENFEVIADVTTGIIVPYNNDVAGKLCALERGEEKYGEKLRHLLKEAQQYSVNVYSNQLERLLKEKMIYEVIPESGIYALSEEFYDAELGLVYESSSENISVLNF